MAAALGRVTSSEQPCPIFSRAQMLTFPLCIRGMQVWSTIRRCGCRFGQEAASSSFVLLIGDRAAPHLIMRLLPISPHQRAARLAHHTAPVFRCV
eukprot:2105289-Rhodomonas_salina.3